MKFIHVYRLLKANGHNPSKAAEIILDATRRDKHAHSWIRILFNQRSSR